jgi:hypothetical protein
VAEKMKKAMIVSVGTGKEGKVVIPMNLAT